MLSQLPPDKVKHLAQSGLWRGTQMAFDDCAFVAIVEMGRERAHV